MAKRCERCLAAFDDTTQTCPYCGLNTEQDRRSLNQLSSEGYLVSRRLLSRTDRSTLPKHATNTEQTPTSGPDAGHTYATNLSGTSHVERTHVEPVHIDVDDELERLRRGYEMSVAATEVSKFERELGSTQHTSGHTGQQQDSSAVLREAHTTESRAVQSVDELIESLRVDTPHAEPEEHADATALTHQEGADTTDWLPSAVPDRVELDDIEALDEMRRRANREYRRTARREAFAGFLRDLATPGSVPHRVAIALFLLVCVWLLIVYVLPAMIGTFVATIESLLPYLIAIVLLIYILRMLIRP